MKNNEINIKISTYLPNHQGNGVMWDPPAKSHISVLGPRCQMPQCDGQLHARVQGLSVKGHLLGNPGSQSFQ